MNPDQEIRAVAAQAAASLVPRGTDIVNFLSACDVVKAYVEGGWDAAISMYSQFEKNQPVPPMTTASQPTGPQPAALIEPMMPPTATPSPPPRPATESNEWIPEPEPTKEPERGIDDNVIPLAASKPVPAQQAHAIHMAHKTIKVRAQSLMGQATVAKVRGHMDRLRTEIEDGGLWDYQVVGPKGEMVSLGKYFTDMYEKRFPDKQ